MKSGFIRVPISMADPEPPPPEPLPFPVRIVRDPIPPPPPPEDSDLPTVTSSKRNDEFYRAWDKFLHAEPKRAKLTSRALRDIVEERKQVQATTGDGLQIEENAAKSWEQAAAECKAKVAAIEEECLRLNQKYRDAMFDLEEGPDCLQSLAGRYPKAVDKIDPPPWIKRVEDIFDSPEFFIDGASATDVHQGSSGDCWFLASLMAVSAKKELIDRLCVARNEKVGVYGFVFFRDGEWIYEVVDDKLFLRVGDDDVLDVVKGLDVEKKEGLTLKFDEEKLKKQLQKGGEALYFSHCKSNETWLPLIEKAYAKAHGDYFAIEGGFASEGIEDLTGGVAVVLDSEGILDKDRFWREQLLQVNKKYLFGGGSTPTGSKGFIGGHAYAVLEAWEEGDLRLLKLRNPWGEVEWEGDWSDGSKLWTAEMMIKLKHTFGDDGVFWISYPDFLKHFPSVNRVRLFDSTWSVGQQWTCVQIPWTVDYLDTKFTFTITERGPIVLVLAQPDDRYFYGLRGRFLYSLHFRVYKEGDESKYIVRSMHNSGNERVFTRSVSAEIEDLEPGTYDVVFKVTAVRSRTSPTAEESILKYAIERKDKLLQVGRRFDYAQTKGNLKAMEREVRRSKKVETREKMNKGWKKDRKINKLERERARLRKERIKEKMREARKEYEGKQRARAKARREKEKKRRQGRLMDGQRAEDWTEVRNEKLENGSLGSSRKAQGAESVQSDAAGKQAEGEAAKTEITLEGEVGDNDSPRNQLEKKNIAKDGDKVEEEVSISLSKLTIDPRTTPMKRPAMSQSHPDFDQFSSSDDEDYNSPISPPNELEDDDFSWDSNIDGPVDSNESTSDDSTVGLPLRTPRNGGNKSDGIFGEDPWQALCVLGLRVYAKGAEPVKVRVVKAESGS